MPMDLGNLTSESARARVDYGAAGDINVVFRPANITEATIERLRAVEAADDDDMVASARAVNGLLCQLVISWDLTRHGEPVALTTEALREVPLGVRVDVLSAIIAEVRIDPKSPAGSPPPVPATPAPAGRDTSPKRVSKRSRKS